MIRLHVTRRGDGKFDIVEQKNVGPYAWHNEAYATGLSREKMLAFTAAWADKAEEPDEKRR